MQQADLAICRSSWSRIASSRQRAPTLAPWHPMCSRSGITSATPISAPSRSGLAATEWSGGHRDSVSLASRTGGHQESLTARRAASVLTEREAMRLARAMIWPTTIQQLLPSLTWTQETCGQQSLSERRAIKDCLGGVEVCQHRWHTQIINRTRLKQPSGCPECAQTARRKPHTRHPSIAEGRPDLLADWDHPLNSKKGWHPDTVTLMSRLPIHWIRTDECRLALPHRWQAPPQSRVDKMAGSPYPSGKSVCDCNSLAVNCKDAAALWDPVLNPDTPDQIAVQSNKVRHWLTPDGRQWQQVVLEVVNTCRRRKRPF